MSTTIGDETQRRGPIEAEIRPPGPKYAMPNLIGNKGHCLTKKQNPAYSMGAPYKSDENRNPAPYYYSDNLTNKGAQKPPSYSLQSRPGQKELEITPGPGAYNTDELKQGITSTERKPKAATMGSLDAWRPMKNWAPAATKYKPNYDAVQRNSRYWSMYDRKDYNSPYYDGCVVKRSQPGPAAYGATDKSTYSRKSAEFSLGGRTKVPVYNTSLSNPAPGKYNPNPVRSQKSVHMGVRHSNFAMVCITDADLI